MALLARPLYVGWLTSQHFYFTEKGSFSLAVGGFFAWRGTAWVSAVIDKAIDKKIDNLSDNNYDYPPRPPRDYDIGDEK